MMFMVEQRLLLLSLFLFADMIFQGVEGEDSEDQARIFLRYDTTGGFY
jgi:hypothetical protein